MLDRWPATYSGQAGRGFSRSSGPCRQGFTEDKAIGAFVSEVFFEVVGFCFVEFGDKSFSLLQKFT